MSDDPRRTGFCTPRCYRVCQCSRWPDMLDRWGNPVNHGQGGGPVIIPWYLSGGVPAANCIAAYTPIGAASLAASYDNNAAPGNGLADGTYDAFPGVAPVFNAALGWGNDTVNNQYLRTGLIVNSNWGVICRFSDVIFFGNQSTNGNFGVNLFLLRPSVGAGGTREYFSGGATAAIVPGIIAGVMVMADRECYLNGAWEATLAAAPAVGSIEEYLLCANNGGAPINILNGYIQAIAYYFPAPSAAQVAAVSAAAAAL